MIGRIVNSNKDYESPLKRLLAQQEMERQKFLEDQDYRTGQQLLYRTDDKFFETLARKKDFKYRNSMVHGKYCFRH